MKITVMFAITALILLCACGSENTESELTAHPVDVWMPLVQVTPPRDIWQTQPNQATGYLNYSRFGNASQRQQLFHEELRIFNFLFPNEPHILISTSPIVPEILSGFLGIYHYSAAIIFHVNKEEAAEYLAYLNDFETIMVHFMPRSFNELTEIVNQINSSNVYPVLWQTTRHVIEGYVLVELFNYSEEEKAFFREHVLDSPYIRFVCAFED